MAPCDSRAASGSSSSRRSLEPVTTRRALMSAPLQGTPTARFSSRHRYRAPDGRGPGRCRSSIPAVPPDLGVGSSDAASAINDGNSVGVVVRSEGPDDLEGRGLGATGSY
jgi:hypothetical protein